MDVIVAHKADIFLGLFLVSEILAIFPGIKANSIFQLLAGWIKSAAGK
jgi:hypothetical protein